MRFVRFAIGSTIGYGVLEDAGEIRAISSTPFLPWEPTDETFDPEQVRILAPVLPSKVVAVGLNYASHAKETGMPLPQEPMIFLKPSTSVIGPGETIYLPSQSQRVDHEGELAVVIGKAARNVSDVAAADSILGYTCANDVTARDLQAKDVQFTRAKGFDTFCPLGPHVVTDLDPLKLELSCRVNDEVRQKSSTSDLVFGPAALVSFVSSVMTLLPGDVLLTGTPAGISPIADGDVVEVEISGIGVLRNPVSA
ncbi:MAG TPA: fumarylacetoacetate hydrolase family protein [Actinomycetota bacterium]|jgi:2-keto-4-pentenoate hydratase/2-oxohepta-3-ene-1,7-dioic acid hydratase in catechol pathway|nr:fumarylacetoacetate hydrolase family protein [Actinomycetota bacterium]